MPAPKLVVVWRVTDACDLACQFCAYSRALGGRRRSAQADQVRAFGRVLAEFGRASGRPILVSWLGGEPLLWKPLFDLSQAFHQDLGLQVSVTTNGTRLGAPDARERLLRDFDEVTVSVDGLGPAHDGVRGAHGLYARLEHNVRQLADLKAARGCGPRLRVNTILMRDNIRALEALGEALAGWGIEELTFNALGGRDRPEFYPDHCLQPSDIDWLAEALPGIRQRLASRGLMVRGSDSYLHRLRRAAARAATPVDDCGPGEAFLFIDEAGMLAPCHFTVAGYGLPLSEIRSAQDLADLPGRFAERRARSRLAACYDCPSTQVWGKFARS